MVEIPTFGDIVAAAARIKPYAVRTPLVESPVLSALHGGRVFLKLETLQRTGSFKFRGAFNRLALIPESERAGGAEEGDGTEDVRARDSGQSKLL